MSVQWDQVWATATPIIVAAGGGLLALWRQRRKEHIENQEMLLAIVQERLYLIPHDHIESRLPGDDNLPLTRGGIIRKPNGPGGAGPLVLRRGGTA